jgi:uncharacterized RDD family membrane protein YckC
MFCSSCGAQTGEGVAFCGACGRPVIGYKVGSSPTEAVAGSTGLPAAGVATGVGVTYAGFWLRVVAALIDGLALAIPMGFVFFLLIISALPTLMTHPPDPMRMMIAILPRLIVFLLITLAATWLYWSLMESSTWQATLGKKALGLYVTDLEGNRVTFGKASGRFFAGRGIGSVPYVGGLYFLVSCILAGLTEKKQALHDIIAGCMVLRKV